MLTNDVVSFEQPGPVYLGYVNKISKNCIIIITLSFQINTIWSQKV